MNRLKSYLIIWGILFVIAWAISTVIYFEDIAPVLIDTFTHTIGWVLGISAVAYLIVRIIQHSRHR